MSTKKKPTSLVSMHSLRVIGMREPTLSRLAISDLEYGVVDDKGVVWELHRTYLGAARAATRRRELHRMDEDSYPSVAWPVKIPDGWIRKAVHKAASEVLRSATEVEIRGEFHGGLTSPLAVDAMWALRRLGKYSELHGIHAA